MFFQAHDQLDTDMMCKIVKFFHKLRKKAMKTKKPLKIGVTIESYSQSLTTSKKNLSITQKSRDWY